MSSYTIIDADTHVTETPELWTSRAPTNMRDRVPRIDTGADGTQRWVLGNSKGLVLGSDNRDVLTGDSRYNNNWWLGEFQKSTKEFSGDASRRLRSHSTAQVHG